MLLSKAFRIQQTKLKPISSKHKKIMKNKRKNNLTVFEPKHPLR